MAKPVPDRDDDALAVPGARQRLIDHYRRQLGYSHGSRMQLYYENKVARLASDVPYRCARGELSRVRAISPGDPHELYLLGADDVLTRLPGRAS